MKKKAVDSDMNESKSSEEIFEDAHEALVMMNLYDSAVKQLAL